MWTDFTQFLRQLVSNYVLASALAAWLSAQLLKLPLHYLNTKEWNWMVLINPGGMPSSHSAISTATALAIGFHDGFDSSLFALAVALATIVVYDAVSIRRQAGFHAEWINRIIEEILRSGDFSYKKLQEVLGHTPFEALAGITLGICTALIMRAVYY
ncbi:MAG TPA: divergent PAP2 family protein [Anaerolineaceae bacterium]|jgi:acid phosphatase family membrane protein YuiD|nr:divergent PAP2 family protein [Anaerolineaceae bacterium]